MLDDLVLPQLSKALRGRYIPSRILGRGSSAVVYLATDVLRDRPVAIKVLQQAASNSTTVERFLREIAILARLEHPHIVPLFDSGDANGMLYYITAYVAGETLRQRIDRASGGGLSIPDAIRLIGEVAAGLDYAHERNVLHRDVKPENILLQDDRAMLADFGIARAIQLMGDSAITDTGIALGTPAYMSPEQLNAERSVDARSDVYALGCVAYEMIAGVPAFIGKRGVVDNTLKFVKLAPTVSAKRPGVAPRLDEAIATALAFEPADRFPTPGAFARALHGCYPDLQRRHSGG
jgi:serine/threonine protein kinase